MMGRGLHRIDREPASEEILDGFKIALCRSDRQTVQRRILGALERMLQTRSTI
jgi:hypothetical protein